MIIKMTNKDEKFYFYMGRFFGSRLVENQTNDRIYDDNNKEWYIYLQDDKALAFVSVNKNIIKNVYTTKSEYLEKLLKEIQKELYISQSIVTNCYEEVYEKSGFNVDKNNSYKNFITIYMNKK